MTQPNIDTPGSLGNVFGASAASGLGGLLPTRQQPGKDTTAPAAPDSTPASPTREDASVAPHVGRTPG